MQKIKKYNPCEEYIESLKDFFNDNLTLKKDTTFLYENKKIYTNITKEDIAGLELSNIFDYDFLQNGIIVINLPYIFYADKISECPEQGKYLVGDLYYDGIIKRMFAQIEFGFYKEGNISVDEIDICDNIFKSIYSKSLAIKYRNIEIANNKYNSLQKEGRVNKQIIYGIIYSVYSYCNLNDEITM